MVAPIEANVQGGETAGKDGPEEAGGREHNEVLLVLQVASPPAWRLRALKLSNERHPRVPGHNKGQNGRRTPPAELQAISFASDMTTVPPTVVHWKGKLSFVMCIWMKSKRMVSMARPQAFSRSQLCTSSVFALGTYH